MIQRTEILVKIVIPYDDDTTTEREAQDRWLDGLPSELQDWAEIVSGLVDADGVKIN